MKFDFEYGQGTMSAELPDNTDIFIPGETVKDPDHIPEDQLEAAYLESLAHPIGMPTLTELAGWKNSYYCCSGSCKRWRAGYQPQKVKH